MRVLVVHQNFPGQFGHLVREWARRPGWDVRGLGRDTAPGMPGFEALLRHKLRTLLTIGSTFIAFFLYGALMTLRMSFTLGVDIAGVDRLMTMNKTSIIQFLPVSYVNDIKAVPGVTSMISPSISSVV